MTPDAAAPADWVPCSDASRDRGDPLHATVGLGRRWLLVEIDGAWGQHAFLQSDLAPGLGRAIARRAEAAGMRPVAIRRFGRRADERRGSTATRWAIADSRPGREAMRWGTVEDPAELLDLPLDGSAGEPTDRPTVLVCTHARHDRCCAVRGRPVAAALAAAYPEETWESSHLGGDRFAGTMVLLPHGLSYGRVPADGAAAILAATARGEIVPAYFRGRSALTPAAQAAEAHARDRTGDLRVDAFAVLGEEAAADGEVTTVRLRHDDDELTVVLRATLSAPLLSTCSARTALAVRRHEPVSMTTVTP